MKELIRARAIDLGFEDVGFCSADPPQSMSKYDTWLSARMHGTMGYLERHRGLRADPQRLLTGAKSAVVVALDYNQPNPVVPGHPHIARYALGRDYHKVLRSMLRRLVEHLEEQDPSANHRICVDSAPVLEREFANRAGLGWYGKNTMLIDSVRGSWFFIGIVLTTLEIEPDAPAHGTCGTCTACIEACPTSAIVQREGTWQVDARKCISYLTIEHKGEIDPDLKAQTGEWTFGCDVCQEVCPFNTERTTQPLRAKHTSVQDFLAKREWPNLKELAQINEQQWDELTRGSAVRRAGLDGLRRNAQSCLSNKR